MVQLAVGPDSYREQLAEVVNKPRLPQTVN